MKITFVTTNKGKIATAQHYFDENEIMLEAYNYELTELQSDDITEIAKSKVMQAYSLVKQPCIAQDSGFYIDALKGFPKNYTKFALDTIGIEGIIKLMAGVENRRCRFKECLAFYDGNETKYFYCCHEGRLSYESQGADNPEKWSDLWYLFIPTYSADGRTLAQYSIAETQERRKHIDSSMRRFADWYKDIAVGHTTP